MVIRLENMLDFLELPGASWSFLKVIRYALEAAKDILCMLKVVENMVCMLEAMESVCCVLDAVEHTWLPEAS